MIKYNNVSVTGQHIALAKKYETESRFNDAFKEYFALIKSEPHKSSYYYDAADLLLKSNEPLRATSVLESMPNYITDYNGLIKNSQCYRIMERWDKAIVLLEKAVNVCKPTDNKETALVLLYDTYLKASQKENARKILTELIKINPNHKNLDNEQNVKVVMTSQKIKPLLDSAVVFARAGRLTEATALLNKSLKIEETSFACSMLGSIYFQTDKAMALKYYEKAELKEEKIKGLYYTGVCNLAMKDYTTASQFLKKTLDYYETNIENSNTPAMEAEDLYPGLSHYWLGKILLDQKMYLEAIEEFNNIVLKYPDNPLYSNAYLNILLANLDMQKWERVVELGKILLTLKEANYDGSVYYYLAMAYENMNLYDMSDKYYKILIESSNFDSKYSLLARKKMYNYTPIHQSGTINE